MNPTLKNNYAWKPSQGKLFKVRNWRISHDFQLRLLVMKKGISTAVLLCTQKLSVKEVVNRENWGAFFLNVTWHHARFCILKCTELMHVYIKVHLGTFWGVQTSFLNFGNGSKKFYFGYHSVWNNPKKSHFTASQRTNWAVFHFSRQKNSIKHFGR